MHTLSRRWRRLVGCTAMWTCRQILLGLQGWRWRQYVPPKLSYVPTSLHIVTPPSTSKLNSPGRTYRPNFIQICPTISEIKHTDMTSYYAFSLHSKLRREFYFLSWGLKKFLRIYEIFLLYFETATIYKFSQCEAPQGSHTSADKTTTESALRNRKPHLRTRGLHTMCGTTMLIIQRR
jgi:hypothetical protein